MDCIGRYFSIVVKNNLYLPIFVIKFFLCFSIKIIGLIISVLGPLLSIKFSGTKPAQHPGSGLLKIIIVGMDAHL